MPSDFLRDRKKQSKSIISFMKSFGINSKDFFKKILKRQKVFQKMCHHLKKKLIKCLSDYNRILLNTQN